MRCVDHKHPIEIPYGSAARIVCFGDVHVGAKTCNLKRFEDRVLRRYANDELVYFLGMGDLVDGIGHMDPRYRPGEGDHRERFVDGQVEDFCRTFERHKISPRRLLGFASGNHEDTVLRRLGSDPTARICERLGAANLGYSFFLRLRTVTLQNVRLPFVIYGHHGFGGSGLEGGAVNSCIRHAFRHPGASAYLYAHNHKKWSVKVPTVSPRWGAAIPRLGDSSIIIGQTGTYMMTYGAGEVPGYAEKKGAYPLETGHLELLLKPVKREVEREKKTVSSRTRLDVSVIE